jgi:hypothetical protein
VTAIALQMFVQCANDARDNDNDEGDDEDYEE